MDGYKMLDMDGLNAVYVGHGRIIITGMPSEDEFHNCDEMGCSSLEHVLYRAFICDRAQFYCGFSIEG